MRVQALLLRGKEVARYLPTYFAISGLGAWQADSPCGMEVLTMQECERDRRAEDLASQVSSVHDVQNTLRVEGL